MSILYVVATPIGNMEDISHRAERILRECDLIAAEDTRHSGLLLSRLGISKPMTSYHKFNENEKSQSIVAKMLSSDIKVALITDAGTPCISDPGSQLVREAVQAGIKVEAIPGPSALISALSICGFNSSYMSFLGFFPRTAKELKQASKEISSRVEDIIVFYESPKRIIGALQSLGEIINKHTQVAVMNDLTKLHEKTVYGSLEDVTKELIDNPNADKGEYVIVIAPRKKSEAAEPSSASISTEALLIDAMIKDNCTLKEAVNILAQKLELPKKDIYNASLNLKNLINN